MGTVMVKISHLQAGTWDCNGKGRLTRGNGVVQMRECAKLTIMHKIRVHAEVRSAKVPGEGVKYGVQSQTPRS